MPLLPIYSFIINQTAGPPAAESHKSTRMPGQWPRMQKIWPRKASVERRPVDRAMRAVAELVPKNLFGSTREISNRFRPEARLPALYLVRPISHRPRFCRDRGGRCWRVLFLSRSRRTGDDDSSCRRDYFLQEVSSEEDGFLLATITGKLIHSCHTRVEVPRV
jgi:hypothetical protein